MKSAAATFLVVLGLLQIAADLSGVEALKGVAIASGASPAPRVFSAVKGLETYSTRFFIEIDARRIEITPERCSRIRGPYNRRNVFGAALAYAPVLPPPLRDAVLRWALCGRAPLLSELGVAPGAGAPAVVLEPREGSSLQGIPTRITAPCR